MSNTWDTPDHCDTCQREMYGFTRNGALICKPCRVGDDLCTYCDGTGFEGGEVGEPCWPCNSTGVGGPESIRAKRQAEVAA
jgi:hypothetical protein